IEFVETPCTPMYLLEGTWDEESGLKLDGVWDKARKCMVGTDKPLADAKPESAEIRIRWHVAENLRPAARADVERLKREYQDRGAFRVFTDEKPIPVFRGRASELLAQARAAWDKIHACLAARNEPADEGRLLR